MKNIVWLLIALFGVAAIVEAQHPKKTPRVGILLPGSRSTYAIRIEAFHNGLRELGYVEGRNIATEWRFVEGKNDRLPGMAAELVRSKVDVIVTSTTPVAQAALQASRTIPMVGHTMRIEIQSLTVRTSDELETTLESAVGNRVGALFVPAGLASIYRKHIMEFAAKKRLPVMFNDGESAEAGGLMSYGVYLPALFHRAAYFVDKILKGAKPVDLPVEQPTKFEFVINLKAAKQIGLTIPPNVLARADRVIR